MCADMSGNIYVADQTNSRIQVISKDGNIRVFVEIPSGWKAPSNICVDSNGNLYVLVRLDNNNITDYQVLKFNASAQLISQWENQENSDSFFETPVGITSDKNGFIYISDIKKHAIIKFTENGDFCVRWDPSGSVIGRFNVPSSIAVDTNRNSYVADSNNHRVQVFNAAGEFQFDWGGKGDNPGQMIFPKTIAADNNDPDHPLLYVSETGNKRIQKFDNQGNLISEFIDNVDSSGIVVDSDSKVYITDMRQDCVLVCSSEGDILTQWEQKGQSSGEFYNPRGIAVDAHNVFVVDTNNQRIQKFTKSGIFITQWGNNDNESVKLVYPTGIAINSNGQIFVTDMDGYRIQVYDSDGNLITQFCEGGNLSGNLYDPLSLAFGPDNLLYVADTFNHRIQVFDYSLSEPPKRIHPKDVSEYNSARAIVVAGGGPYPGNDLWNVIQYNANFAYQILNYNEFSKDQIVYLSHPLNYYPLKIIYLKAITIILIVKALIR
jgi:sugar lactone lactonase YvrE